MAMKVQHFNCALPVLLLWASGSNGKQSNSLIIPQPRNPPVADGVALRILPLGDSITYGYLEHSGNSYRRALSCLLWTNGNPIAFIGTQNHGDWLNNANDGFTGQLIDEISLSAEHSLTQWSKPNIVLLHAGTNDVIRDIASAKASARLGVLIDKISTLCPDAALLVAQILPHANTTVNGRISTFNDEIDTVVNSRAFAGTRIRLVSMAHVPIELLFDETHPNEPAYWLMAGIWYAGIRALDMAGLIVPTKDQVWDVGASALPQEGGCEELVYNGVVFPVVE